MQSITDQNGQSLEVTSSITEQLFTINYAENEQFHIIEATYSKDLDLANTGPHKLLIKRFTDTITAGSQMSEILKNPSLVKFGINFEQKEMGCNYIAKFILPKADWLNEKLASLNIKSSYKFVEHRGSHIDHWQYVKYLAAGQYPLANDLSWQMIHDRVDHIIGAISVSAQLAEQQNKFAQATLELRSSNPKLAETQSLTLTDFVDELTYKTTILAGRPDSKSFVSELYEFLDSKIADSSQIIRNLINEKLLSSYLSATIASAQQL